MSAPIHRPLLLTATAGINYWYGSASLPDALEAHAPNHSTQRLMRRASDAVAQAAGIQM